VKESWNASPAIRSGSLAMLETADWLLEHLPQMSVLVPPGCRLLLARRLLERVQERLIVPDATDEELLRRITDAHRTISEFYIIMRAIRSRPALWNHPLRAKVSTMMGGHEVEEQDTNSIHRNTQFELYVLALFLMGGATVSLGEPDLRLLYGSEEVGVSVKRLRSPKQLRRRVMEAADQIESQHLNGFIAVNFDLFTVGVGGPQDAENVASRGRQFEEALSPVYALMHEFADRPSVLGLMNYGYSAHWENDAVPPRHSFGFFRQTLRFTDTPAEIALAHEYFGTLSARIENALSHL
jgi:hypothetical protein